VRVTGRGRRSSSDLPGGKADTGGLDVDDAGPKVQAPAFKDGDQRPGTAGVLQQQPAASMKLLHASSACQQLQVFQFFCGSTVKGLSNIAESSKVPGV
jgi:hypothetical protein